MSRSLAVALLLVLSAGAAVAGAATSNERAYARANAHLARKVPHYPGARLLIEERVSGEAPAGTTFRAVQRISRPSRPLTQAGALRFYQRELGPAWRARGARCLVSRSRVVVVVVNPKPLRLGVLVDSRGAARCADLGGLLRELLALGYPR